MGGMAKTKCDPLVLFGDFNIKPGSSAYMLFAGGCLGHEDAPDIDQYRRIYTDLPLRSAYCSFHGAEPGPRTVDYIWISEGCLVQACPTVDASALRPSSSEPSDHPMLEAVIELPVP